MKRGRLLAVVCGLSLICAGLSGAARIVSPPERSTQQTATLVKHLRKGSLSLPPSLAGATVGGVATDAADNLYVGVTRGDTSFVAVYDRSGNFVREWLIDRRSLVLRLREVRLAVGPDNLVYVAPQHASSPDELIKVFTPTGVPVRSFGAGSQLSEVTDIEVDAAGNTFVTSRARPGDGVPDDVVVRFNAAGALTARFAWRPGQRGQTANSLHALALGPDGSIYLATEEAARPLVRLDQSGARATMPDFSSLVPGRIDDVDFARGSLYFSGKVTQGRDGAALLVATPQGKRIDLVPGEAHFVAVASNRVYLSGQTASVALASHAPGVASYTAFPTVPGSVDSYGAVDCSGGGSAWGLGAPGSLLLTGDPGTCEAEIINARSPWPRESCTPVRVYVGGEQRGTVTYDSTTGGATVVIQQGDVRSGSVIVEWVCGPETRYENKGELEFHDPSGNVLDRRTGRPIRSATVRLEFTPARSGTFGTPSLALLTPQINPQITGATGAFAWDVAPGFWRLRVTAFGYRPLISPVYNVPPEVTGLKLRLSPDPKQQAVLIDPLAGRVGNIRVGSRVRTSARGLRLKIVRRTVRGISVRSARYRTMSGIRLGSSAIALKKAYPAQALARERATRGRRYTSLRVGKATFTLRRNRVAAIALGR